MTGFEDFKLVWYDDRHGGPYDRGSADSWYDRPRRPHYFVGDTYSSQEVTVEDMTEEEIEAYQAGYDFGEESGEKKQW
jgi:hypothetical protein